MSIYPRIDGYARYWGQASVVLDSDELFRQSGIVDHPTLQFLLRSEDKSTGEFNTIFGDPALLDEDSVNLQANLPGTSWIISAVPIDGWQMMG